MPRENFPARVKLEDIENFERSESDRKLNIEKNIYETMAARKKKEKDLEQFHERREECRVAETN